MKTGVCYKFLDPSIALTLQNRIKEIKDSKFINALLTEFQKEEQIRALDSESWNTAGRRRELATSSYSEAQKLIGDLEKRIGYVHPPQGNYDPGHEILGLFENI